MKKNKIETQLSELLTDITSTAGDAKAFILSELPDVAREILAYAIIYNSVFAVINISLCILIIWGIIKAVKLMVKKFGMDQPMVYFSFFILTLIGLLPSLVCLVNFFVNIEIIIKVSIAPKLYLIEYAGDLLK